MKLTLSKRSVCPPDGFRYVFPTDGWVCHAWTYDAWVDAAKHHLQANNQIVPVDLEEDMETQLCLTLPPGWCLHDDPNRPRVSTSLEWGDVQSGLATFAKWIAGGARYVAQEEADRRALICSRCFYNTHVSGCTTCHKAVAAVTGNAKSKYDFALKGCAVCKCLLRAAVHFPMSTLESNKNSLHQDRYPSFCWRKIDGNNYVP